MEHKKEMVCFLDIKYIKCEELVNKTLPCGHLKETNVGKILNILNVSN